MIKLLAVDMDGTCLDGRSRMTDRTLCALRKAAEKGIIIVPATGRIWNVSPTGWRREPSAGQVTPDDHCE